MNWFDLLIYGWMGVGIITLTALVVFKIRAPYGRHANDKWGKMIDNKWGWIIMEMPALVLTPLLALLGPSEKDGVLYLIVAMWLLHYVNRTLIFPFRLKTKGKKMPLTIVFSAIFFNGVNGFVNGFFLGYLYSPGSFHLTDAHVLIGGTLFMTGMIINHIADTKLIGLRKQNQGYQIPKGWLFEYISCPNHFGEMIEWIGFAIVAYNMAAVSFAVWTICNLIPRTLNHHAWYKETFNDYPKDRKAVIPYLL